MCLRYTKEQSVCEERCFALTDLQKMRPWEEEAKRLLQGKDLIAGFDGRRAVKKFFPVLKFTTISVAQVIGRSGLLCDF